MRTLPYFPFYPSEWIQSPTVMGMSLAEKGAFITLLCVQWSDGFVDPEDIEMILGLDEEMVVKMFSKRVWQKAFPIGKDGMRCNARLALERDTAIHKVEVASRAAHARWDKHKASGSPVRKRKSAIAELQAAIEEYNAGNPNETLTSDLVEAMTSYMKSGQKDGRQLWSQSKWLKNFPDALVKGVKYTQEEWTEAWRQGTRNSWGSVWPKSDKNTGPGPKPTNRALNNLAAWSDKADGAY